MTTFILTILSTIGLILGIYLPLKYIKDIDFSTGIIITSTVAFTVLLVFMSSVIIEVDNKIATEYTKKIDSISQDTLFEFIVETRVNNPKVILAQAIEESGHFKSNNFKTNNNLFGMKKTYLRVRTVSKNNINQYKHYDNWQQSVMDYIIWQLQQSKLKDVSDMEYIDYLSDRYAENPNYKRNLLKIYNSLKYE